jgi:hypothetical protein
MTDFNTFLNKLNQNLKTLEDRAMKYSALSKDNSPTNPHPGIEYEQKKIQSLEQKGQLDPSEQRLLAIHRRNLELYQQGAVGVGPQHPPMELLNQIDDHKEAISLTEQVIEGKIDEAQWREGLKQLLVIEP